MRDLSVDQWVNVGASTLAALSCAAFILTYHVQAPWWRSDIGRNLMGFAAAVGALCLYTVLITLWPGGWASVALRSIRTVVVLGIAALMIQRTLLVMRAQHPPKERTGA